MTHKIIFTALEDGSGTIEVDGVEIGSIVKRAYIVPTGAEIMAGRVRVDLTTRVLLKKLGWTPPPEEESRREQAIRRSAGL
jgi:hypothetical protein